MATTEERVIAILWEVLSLPSVMTIETGSSLTRDLTMDIRDVDLIISALEDNFGIIVYITADEFFDKINTVDDLIKYVDRLVTEQS